MLDTFKARLKAKAATLKVNLSQKRIDAIADRLHKKHPNLTEEADHDEQIEELHELSPLDEIAKTDDRMRSLEKRNPEPAKPDENKDQPPGNPPADDVPVWARGLIDEVKSLRAEKQQSSIKTQLSESLKGKSIPEKFYSKRALPEKAEDLDAFVAEIEADWTELKQDANITGLAATSVPGSATGGTPSTATVDADIEAWASKGAEKK